jgi:hypothetical protein
MDEDEIFLKKITEMMERKKAAPEPTPAATQDPAPEQKTRKPKPPRKPKQAVADQVPASVPVSVPASVPASVPVSASAPAPDAFSSQPPTAPVKKPRAPPAPRKKVHGPAIDPVELPGDKKPDDKPVIIGEAKRKEQDEREEIKNKFIEIISVNPNVKLDTPEKFKEIAKRCNEMPLDELRLQLAYAQRLQYQGIDNKIAHNVLKLCSAVIGGVLDCNEQLQKKVDEDKYLQEITGSALGENVLHLLPNYMKIAGLYSSHVISAYREAPHKKPVPQQKQLPKPAEVPKPAEPIQNSTTLPLPAPPQIVYGFGIEKQEIAVPDDKKNDFVPGDMIWNPSTQKHEKL